MTLIVSVWVGRCDLLNNTCLPPHLVKLIEYTLFVCCQHSPTPEIQRELCYFYIQFFVRAGSNRTKKLHDVNTMCCTQVRWTASISVLLIIFILMLECKAQKDAEMDADMSDVCFVILFPACIQYTSGQYITRDHIWPGLPCCTPILRKISFDKRVSGLANIFLAKGAYWVKAKEIIPVESIWHSAHVHISALSQDGIKDGISFYDWSFFFRKLLFCTEVVVQNQLQE